MINESFPIYVCIFVLCVKKRYHHLIIFVISSRTVYVCIFFSQVKDFDSN
jgi:hypothetical protein